MQSACTNHIRTCTVDTIQHKTYIICTHYSVLIAIWNSSYWGGYQAQWKNLLPVSKCHSSVLKMLCFYLKVIPCQLCTRLKNYCHVPIQKILQKKFDYLNSVYVNLKFDQMHSHIMSPPTYLALCMFGTSNWILLFYDE